VVIRFIDKQGFPQEMLLGMYKLENFNAH